MCLWALVTAIVASIIILKKDIFLSCHEEKTLSSNEKLSPRPLDSL